MHSDAASVLALSRPVQSEVQEELLVHVSGELVNTVVISPLLFRLSVAFSSKSPGSQEGPVLLYTIGQEVRKWDDEVPLKVSVSHPLPTL